MNESKIVFPVSLQWEKAEVITDPNLDSVLNSMFNNVVLESGNGVVVLPDAKTSADHPIFVKLISKAGEGMYLSVVPKDGQFVEENDSHGIFTVGQTYLFVSDGSNWWIYGCNTVMRNLNIAESTTIENLCLRPTLPVPTSSTSAGKYGSVTSDTNFIYYCIADNQWIRFKKDAAAW